MSVNQSLSAAGTTAAATAQAVAPSAEYDAALAVRRRSYGPNTSLSYERPIMVVRGEGTYLYDERGLSYLDCVNNVTHVGHGNPEVAAAVCSQLQTLNTNSRYLHPGLPEYTEALLRTLNYQAAPKSQSPQPPQPPQLYDPNVERPGQQSTAQPGTTAPATPVRAPSPTGPLGDPSSSSSSCSPGPTLDVLYLVCSGSEANDLALRIALAARPGRTHVAVMGGAYHGHLSSLIPLSPYKFWGPGGEGRAPYVHVVPCPDPYRGQNLDGRAAALAVLESARQAGGQLATFFCESILSCGGQVVLPHGYLEAMYQVFRSAGVVLVADEVQCGFGRCGSAFWGFQTQRLRPDIVTMGKPIGNGYPMAALATSRELAAAFAGPGMEYFNTYGGSTAAVAAGLVVLRILQRDGLQQHAQQVGEHLLAGLRRLQADHEVVGDVRGIGLFLGVEVVVDKASKRHAPVMARWIKERLKVRRVLLSTDGPYDNVLKIKPPMVFGIPEADVLMRELSDVLSSELTHDVRRELLRREEDHWAAVMAPRQRHYIENSRRLMGLLPPLPELKAAGLGSHAQPPQEQQRQQPHHVSRL